MRRNILAFCTVLLLIFIAACEKQATEPKVGNPTITILTPSEGQELYGIVNVEVFGHDVEGHGLEPETVVDTQGRVHPINPCLARSSLRAFPTGRLG